MSREIKLSGSEISALKAIGLNGTQVYGKQLLDRMSDAEHLEFLETLIDLIDRGFVLANRVNIRTIEEVEKSLFRVSPTYSRDLRDAMNPDRRRTEARDRRDRRG